MVSNEASATPVAEGFVPDSDHRRSTPSPFAPTGLQGAPRPNSDRVRSRLVLASARFDDGGEPVEEFDLQWSGTRETTGQAT